MLGDPVLATIELRAIPHWMPWAREGRSLSTFVMSIHHLDTFRYWLGDPERVLASTRRDPRTEFAHDDGINLYILEFAGGARASAWDDVWAGPAQRRGRGRDRRSLASRGDRRARPGHDRLARLARPRPQHDRLLHDPRPGRTGIARAGGRRGFPTPSPARWGAFCTRSNPARARYLGPRQPEDNRPV